MKTLRRWWWRCMGVFGSEESDRALAEELRQHVLLDAAENERRGMTPEAALREARINFGSTGAVAESYRDQRGVPFVEITRQDLRYALRGIRHDPGFALVAILSTALGIGANTAIFSVVKTVLLDPLGYADAQRIFAVREHLPQISRDAQGLSANPLHFREWAKACPSLDALAGAKLRAYQFVTRGGEPEELQGARVSTNLLALLGVHPMLGRDFSAEDGQAGAAKVVLISESLWRRRFEADPSAVGGAITLEGESYTIAGVLPASFQLPYGGGMTARTELVKPPEVFEPLIVPAYELRPIGNFNYGALIRLKPGVTAAKALAEINVVEARFPKQAGMKMDLSASLIPLPDLFTGSTRTGLWMLLGAVSAVMLIVCINLANLLLAKNAARQRESAIRGALGASASRQMRQAVTESLTLAALGGAIGVAIAAAALRIVAVVAPPDLFRIRGVHVDMVVLLFALLASLITGVVFGVLPAWHLSRIDPRDALQSGGRSATASKGALTARRILIGAEVALSSVLLIIGGLLINSFVRLVHADKGFRTDQVLAADLSVSRTYYPQVEARARLLQGMIERVAAIPGVESAGLITLLPSQGETWMDPIGVEGDPRPSLEWPMVNNLFASGDYFRTAGIDLKIGRTFALSDWGKPVGILSEKAARRLWPAGVNPIGRRYRGAVEQTLTLVGIVADVRSNLDRDPPPIAYYPFWLFPPYRVSLVAHTRLSDPISLAAAVRSAIWSQDKRVPITDMRTLTNVVDSALMQRRFQLVLVSAFSAFALLVATLGVYGVVAFTVARQRGEIGIRMALGAPASRVMRGVITQGIVPVAVGLAAGIGIALSVGRLLQGLLFEVRTTDVQTIAGGVLVILLASLAACVVPAWRALTGNPLSVLRMD